MNHELIRLTASSASFIELLREYEAADPTLTPTDSVPHGTTIVAATSVDGVVMAGDRRATMGNVIVLRDVEKVSAVDGFTVMGVAGTAGIAAQMQRLFAVELEHYEKIERESLSLSGKARRLAGMIRGHLGLARQGLVVVPVLAGWDAAVGLGRMFTFDVAGGCYEERDWCALGSGAPYARGSMKKLYRDGASTSETVTMLIQALVDAADEDSATAAFDVNRGIYPSVVTVDQNGTRTWTDQDLAEKVAEVVASRQHRPDGPGAPIL